MNETEVLNEFFIWEEKSLIELKMKSENNGVNEHKDITNETKTVLTPNDWKDITDPKLREQMRQKAYYETNKDKIKNQAKSYCELNSNKVKERKKNYYNKNKVKVIKKSKDYYKNNKEKKKEYDKVYRKNNKKKRNDRDKLRRKNDTQYKLTMSLRSRLNNVLKRNQKVGSAVKDLGCTVDELISYLESKFQPEMSWDNWSKDGWHIDHIKPLTSFDLTDRKQLLEACHYTNLQPLWAKDNLVKSDKII
jgi:hypothetical protein